MHVCDIIPILVHVYRHAHSAVNLCHVDIEVYLLNSSFDFRGRIVVAGDGMSHNVRIKWDFLDIS